METGLASVAAEAVGAAGAVLGAIVASSISYLRLRWERQQWAMQNVAQPGTIRATFQTFLSEWSAILGEVEALFATSVIDRFLILEGTNGKEQIERVTAFFQLRAEGQYPYPYKNYRIDDHYRGVLRYAEKNLDGCYMQTAEMPVSGLRRIYVAEGVTSAVVHFLGAELVDGRREIIYCSFATHEGGMSEETLTKIEIIASRIRFLCEAGSNGD